MSIARNVEFTKMFGEYMGILSDDLFEYSDNLGYHPLIKWILNKKSICPSTSYTHTYEVSIPHLITVGHIDSQKEDPIRVQQYVPSEEQYIAHFTKYFDKYKLISSNHNGEIKSQVQVTLVSQQSDETLITIVVSYYKSHRPYPTLLYYLREECDRLTADNNAQKTLLNQQNAHLIKVYKQFVDTRDQLDKVWDHKNELETVNANQRTMIGHLNTVCFQHTNTIQDIRCQLINLQTKLDSVHLRLGNTIRTMYSEKDKKEDCPVCYESICAESLIVPGCGHLICGECSSKCTDCPICRQSYCLLY